MRIGIRPTVDVVFKKIFGSPEHEEITRDFLNAIFPFAGVPEVTHIDILNPFRLADFEGDKDVTVDIHAKDVDERDVQIEMQIRNDEALSSRMLDNWARLYSAQLKRGMDYRKHHPLIALWILEASHFADEHWIHVFRSLEGKTGAVLTADMVIVTVELKKWEALSISPETDKFKSPLDEWLWFLAAGEDIDTADAGFLRLRHEIGEAVEIMQEFTKSDKARYTYERRLDWERTINAIKYDAQKAGFTEGLKEGLAKGIADGMAKGIADGMAKGIADGKAEGMAEGMAEGQRMQALEDARKFKELGVSIEVIAKATGLPEAEIASLGYGGEMETRP